MYVSIGILGVSLGMLLWVLIQLKSKKKAAMMLGAYGRPPTTSDSTTNERLTRPPIMRASLDENPGLIP